MDDTPTTLLIAGRDEPQREFLVDQFLADRFAAQGAQCSEEARIKLANLHPRVLVLAELEQPHDALSLLRAIRSGGDGGLLVIVASVDGSELAELRAFREGCDDYLRKPIGYPLLLARVRALVRRSNGRLIPRRRIGALEVDAVQRQVAVAGRARAGLADGVRVAVAPRRRAHPRVQQGGAAAEGVAVRGSRKHAHGRCPRLPAAQEARAGGSAAPHRQCAGGRVRSRPGRSWPSRMP
jgi:CheY-like chemotaxis protein